MKILSYIVAAALLVIGSSDLARAQNCAAYPYTLTNGQPADANQVMSNFNTVRGCGNNSLLGKNNNLSDLQSPATARTNLGLGTAAVENLANATAAAVTDDGAGNLILSSYPSMHSQSISATGNFTVPAGTLSTTVFKITLIGGGGGGGDPSGGWASSGASGCAVTGYFSGFTAGATVTVNIGAGGGHGSTGSSSTVVYAATTVITASGGAAGTQANNLAPAAGACSVAAGASGLSLANTVQNGAQNGAVGVPAITGASSAPNGGGNAFGTGGLGSWYNGTTSQTGGNGTLGGGGGAGARASNGGTGGNGFFTAEWVL